MPRTADASEPIVWEVKNRYRLIATAEEEKRFHRHLSAYILESRQWMGMQGDAWPLPYMSSDLLYTSRIPFSRGKARGPGDNFATHYDTRATSYGCRRDGPPDSNPRRDRGCQPTAPEKSWVQDPQRTVTLKAPAWANYRCDWTVGSASHANKPCGEYEAQVPLQTPTKVIARRIDGGGEHATTVEVHDIKIVALGDSYSAGEGVPHSQWRLFSLTQRPAYWLDPRCHRSLLSGPSLAAAYVAEHNPHASVTLLHYGCAGASVADGVVYPWAHLETSKSVDAKWKRYEWIGAKRPPDQETAEQGHSIRAPQAAKGLSVDYPRSQIQQAQKDLAGIQPDAVFVTIGGNDIGFGSIVRGLAVGSWVPDLVPGYLKGDSQPASALDEQRAAATFDDAAWIAVAKADNPEACMDLEKARNTACAVAIVNGRINRPDGAPGYLKQQYKLLAPAMDPIRPASNSQIFITEYPNFIDRFSDDARVKELHAPDWSTCEDRFLDKRPDFVPPPLNVAFGIRKQDAEKARTLLEPLNDAVNTLKDEGWTVIDQHKKDGLGHGYCSFDRWYNTYGDSLWNQGNKPLSERPLGNFRVGTATNLVAADGRVLQPGDGVVWSADDKCFVLIDAAGVPTKTCVKRDDRTNFTDLPDPVFHEMTRSLSSNKSRIKPPKLDTNRITAFVNTTGPVHPNLFGHCNYAAALATAVGRSDGIRAKLSPSWVQSLKGQPLDMEAVCKPAAWGFEARE